MLENYTVYVYNLLDLRPIAVCEVNTVLKPSCIHVCLYTRFSTIRTQI